MYARDKVLKNFYDSRKWRKMRTFIRTRDEGMCQECPAVGTEVHHIKPITRNNVSDVNVSLNPDNLILLCKSCHNKQRGGAPSVRSDITFDSEGNVIKKDVY